MQSVHRVFAGSRPLRLSNGVLAAAAVLWAAAVAVGLGKLWAYENKPGPASHVSLHWPDGGGIARDMSRPTLLVFAHPHCPCSRASIRELARLVAHVGDRVSVHVLFVRPAGAAPDWEQTDLWDAAASIPGVRASVVGSTQAGAFGARVSGEAFLYGNDGGLLFAGGLTRSRGHEGDNAGRDAVTELVMNAPHQSALRRTFAFGCFLTDEHAE